MLILAFIGKVLLVVSIMTLLRLGRAMFRATVREIVRQEQNKVTQETK